MRSQQILESLTPGGSEYFNDPERCGAYIKAKIQSQHELIKSQVKRLKEAEEEQGEMIEDVLFLNALDAAGVDNWVGYEEAKKIMEDYE